MEQIPHSFDAYTELFACESTVFLARGSQELGNHWVVHSCPCQLYMCFLLGLRVTRGKSLLAGVLQIKLLPALCTCTLHGPVCSRGQCLLFRGRGAVKNELSWGPVSLTYLHNGKYLVESRAAGARRFQG